MSDHFEQVYNCVDRYFKDSLKQGRSVYEIMESFREDPLPVDLTMCKFPTEELRRHGQLVSTKYIIKEKHNECIKLPECDPVGVQM